MSEVSGAMKVAPQEDITALLLRQLIDSQAAMESMRGLTQDLWRHYIHTLED